MTGKSKRAHIAHYHDYDRVLLQSVESPSLHCLSATTKMLLLSVVDAIGWTSRYIGEADKQTVEGWRDLAMSELIMGMCLDEFCAALTLAVTECPDFMAALDGWAAGQGFNDGGGDPEGMIPLSELETNLLPDTYSCDDDHRYGMAVGIVNAIHTATVEVFEAIELATNPLELTAEISDNVPFWEIVSSGIDVALYIQETLYEAYISAWSETVLDELSCAVFCAMIEQGTCNISLKMLIEVYIPTGSIDTPSWYAPGLVWLAWLVTLPLTSALPTVKIAGLMGLVAMAFGGKFGGFNLGVRSLTTTIALLADDTNSDHSILCDTCPAVWVAFIDFALTDGGFILETVRVADNIGVHIPGLGWEASMDTHNAAPGHTVNAVSIRLELSIPTEMEMVTMTYDYTLGTWTSANKGALTIWRDGAFSKDYDELTDGVNFDINTPTDQETCNNFDLFIRSRFAPTDTGTNGYGLIRAIRINGVGPIPDELLAYIE